MRWIDVNKGDGSHPNYRSRLVAKEFNNSLRPDLFAATPPTEGVKLLLHKLTSGKGKRNRLKWDGVFHCLMCEQVYEKKVDLQEHGWDSHNSAESQRRHNRNIEEYLGEKMLAK